MVVPSVSQQLSAIRHTIAKTILPALDPDARFAHEQAGLVLASLDWAMDVVESEHRYELVEHTDQRRLLEALLALGPADAADDARKTLDAAGTPPRISPRSGPTPSPSSGGSSGRSSPSPPTPTRARHSRPDDS